jgi:CBS domain-containing protein
MISDIARTNVLTAAPHTTVGQAIDAMRTHGAQYVVVLREQSPVGVLSAADVGFALDAETALSELLVSELVTPTRTIRANASREGLLSRFREIGDEHLVVVDGGDEFVGVVSRRDLLAVYADELSALFDLFSSSH